MEQEVENLIASLEAQERARQEALAWEQHQYEVRKQAFGKLLLKHINEVKYKKDLLYLIFYPSRFYNYEENRLNVIYKAAYDFHWREPLPRIAFKREYEFHHKGDEILSFAEKDDWNWVWKAEYWEFLERICPEHLRLAMARLRT